MDSQAECTVVDVSQTGAGLLVSDGVQVHEGETLVLDLERIGSTPVGYQLHATVRNVGSPIIDHGGVRVGVNFTFESPMEQRIAKTLLPE